MICILLHGGYHLWGLIFVKVLLVMNFPCTGCSRFHFQTNNTQQKVIVTSFAYAAWLQTTTQKISPREKYPLYGVLWNAQHNLGFHSYHDSIQCTFTTTQSWRTFFLEISESLSCDIKQWKSSELKDFNCEADSILRQSREKQRQKEIARQKERRIQFLSSVIWKEIYPLSH